MSREVAIRVTGYHGRDIRSLADRQAFERACSEARRANEQERADAAIESLWHERVRTNTKEQRRIARIIGPLPTILRRQAD